MANSNRKNPNRWNDNSNYNNYRDNDQNRHWESENRRNSSLHQGNWNKGGSEHEENYGLGDTSQGSANYGHVDEGHGARYYGTGSYGGYFGSGSDDEMDDNNRGQGHRRDYEGRSDNFENRDNRNNVNRQNNVNRRSNANENYGRGPGYGNSNIHGRSDSNLNYSGRNIGPGSEYRRNYENYGRNKVDDRRPGNSDRYSRQDNDTRSGDWDSDRDWWDKTTDEVSSWFGDEGAAHRRDLDRVTGPHWGKGPKGYKRSDDKIKDDIEEKLYHDSFIDASDIEVSVSDGDVTLSGTVDNKQTKRRAEDCADRVTGVKDVSNHLRINHSPSSSYSSENASLTKGKITGSLSEKDQKLDQSNDLNRTVQK